MKILKRGDTVIFDSVSRMSRNAEEGFQLYMELLEKGINLEFINEPHINTDYYKKMQAANCRHCKIRQGICGNEEPDHKDVEVLFRQHVR